MTPYTTKTGLQIGLLYKKPPPQLSHDEEVIQSILLRDRAVVWHHIANEWLGYIFLCVLIVLGFWALA